MDSVVRVPGRLAGEGSMSACVLLRIFFGGLKGCTGSGYDDGLVVRFLYSVAVHSIGLSVQR